MKKLFVSYELDGDIIDYILWMILIVIAWPFILFCMFLDKFDD